MINLSSIGKKSSNTAGRFNLPTVPTEFAGEGFDAFALVSEQQPDRERLAREQQERDAAKAALEQRQIQLL